ncbi:hypothetical protein F8M41_009539 [Gigaspora margarita]|uniref:Uncharacterized protein n=1 Tax=Gigaspora margarita TaxID=4874 RepID=A0A8H4A1M3_GIGMA|nr:hypothetical protein F8M41_009539 [Gigaspora margarita]
MSTVSLVRKGTFARGRKRISFSGVLGGGGEDDEDNMDGDDDDNVRGKFSGDSSGNEEGVIRMLMVMEVMMKTGIYFIDIGLCKAKLIRTANFVVSIIRQINKIDGG